MKREPIKIEYMGKTWTLERWTGVSEDGWKLSVAPENDAWTPIGLSCIIQGAYELLDDAISGDTGIDGAEYAGLIAVPKDKIERAIELLLRALRFDNGGPK